ncbi:MAG: hypothetical protein KC478_14845 [Bacteriovoracaceae bacterium]|nr:hypothetical protein [Bacteriovoracaceae bacterium]
MEKKIKDFLSNKLIFMVTDNKLDRTSWKKTFNGLNVRPDQIMGFEKYRDAIREMDTSKPHILLCSSRIKETVADGLLDKFRSLSQNRADDLCYIVCEEGDEHARLAFYHFELDGMIEKPYTANDLNNKLRRGILTKSRYTSFEKAKHKSFENIHLKNFEKVEAFVDVALKDNSKDPDVRLMEALLQLERGNRGAGVATLLEVGEGCSREYFLRNKLFELLYEDKRYEDAFEQAKLMISKYPLPPLKIQEFVRVSILTRNYTAIVDYSQHVSVELLKDKAVAQHLAAGLVLSSKFLGADQRDRAVEANIKAVNFGREKKPIVEQALTNLCDLGEFNKVQELINELSEQEELESTLKIAEYRVLEPLGESPARVFQKGMDLTNKGVRDFYVYEILLRSAVKVGRKRESLVELAEDAGKHHPAKQQYFKSLIAS